MQAFIALYAQKKNETLLLFAGWKHSVHKLEFSFCLNLC